MKKMLDFITELTNSIGVPVMLIGTYGAMRPLTKLFRMLDELQVKVT